MQRVRTPIVAAGILLLTLRLELPAAPKDSAEIPKCEKPLAFTMPDSGHVSLIIKNAEGRVVRHLLNSHTREKGEHIEIWDGLDTPVWNKPGKPVPPGAYTWSAIWHTGIGLKLRGWAYHGPSDPWDVTPTSYWGGDHGVPVACAADGENVYLGWAGAEVGKALIALGPDDNVIWGAGFHFNSAGLVAVSDGAVYYPNGGLLKRVDAKTGRPLNWEGRDSGDLPIRDIWGEDAPEGMPVSLKWHQGGLAALNGKLYMSFSQLSWDRSDVRDWRIFLGKLVEKDNQVSKAIWSRLHENSREVIPKWLKSDTPMEIAFKPPNYRTPEVRDDVITILGSLGNRRMIEATFPDDLIVLRNSFLAVIDAHTGMFIKRIDLRAPGKIVALRDDLLYVLTERTKLITLNPQTGETKPLIAGLGSMGGLTVDKSGNIYIGIGGSFNQIRVYTSEGHLKHIIGRRGGRVRNGPWKTDGVTSVWGLAIDARGRLWAAEAGMIPKRVSVWNPDTGKFIKEFLGPTHYGASGGAINPHDPNLIVGESCEFRIDPETGRAKLLGILTREYPHSASRFCEGENGRLFYAATFKARSWQINIWERLGDARYAYRAVIRSDVKAGKTTFWCDENGDQRSQFKTEVQTFPEALQLGGYNHWSMSLNTDFTFYGTGKTKTYQFKVGGFAPSGAPRYDLENVKELPRLPGGPMPSPDNSLIVSCDAGAERFRCYEVATGKLRWAYPNTFHGVHGSHYAPGPAIGMIRGAFGFVGSAALPNPVGAIWAINTNVGEWHILNEAGYYLTRLFQGDESKQKWPEKAQPGIRVDDIPPGLGGEDFGGSMIQGKDGKVYIQAGKLALWNIEMVGLDTVKDLASGSVEIGQRDALAAMQARGRHLQSMTESKRMTIPKMKIDFTGNPDKDFAGATWIRYAKDSGHQVRSTATWDGNHLYLAWDVRDSSPWQNRAEAPHYMYTGGDTVDFQIGTRATKRGANGRPVKGDLRISIGNFNGVATAVLYEERGKGDKADRKEFNSGVIQGFTVGRVELLKKIKIKVETRENSYAVEARIPLKTLGLKKFKGAELRGDFGVTHSDSKGQNTALRTYWSNQASGIVNDEVFELKIDPSHWGVLDFTE